MERRSEPRKNYLQASRFTEWPPGPSKRSPCFLLRLQASAILSPRPAFWSQIKKYLAFTFTKNFFFKESQHDKIVYNDTIFIKKSILIEIKGFIFAFLNFTNSLSCEELLQFYIKTDKFYIISQGFYVQIKQYQRQFTNQCSVCKILEFLSFNKFNFIYKYFF